MSTAKVSHHSDYFFFLFFFLLSTGELGVYLHDHLHPGVLPEDSGVRLSVPRRRLLAELLEHTGLCHRLHGVSLDLPVEMNIQFLSVDGNLAVQKQ